MLNSKKKIVEEIGTKNGTKKSPYIGNYGVLFEKKPTFSQFFFTTKTYS